jgi:transcriptional regulator with XRE-family HTH domain
VPTLRDLRTAKVLSLQELADAAGVSKSTVRGIEQGRVPHPSTRRSLAAALGVDPHQILWPEVGTAATRQEHH